MPDPLETAKEGITLVGEIIKVAGNNPDVKAAGANLGLTALTLTRAINNALLPLAAINFAFEKAKKYFSENFQEDISAKASAIPPEQLVEPKASIAGPALQGLAFSHEEPSLKDMYLSLLATSMDGRVSTDAHPAFVEIIKQLTAEEAELLHSLLRINGSVPIVEVRLASAELQGWQVLRRNLLNLTTLQSELVENERGAAMVDNWVRLGLVEVDYTKVLLGGNQYAWVENRPEYLRYKAENESEQKKVNFAQGVIGRTALGQQFGKAVGLL